MRISSFSYFFIKNETQLSGWIDHSTRVDVHVADDLARLSADSEQFRMAFTIEPLYK
jgi:hypothetical protein